MNPPAASPSPTPPPTPRLPALSYQLVAPNRAECAATLREMVCAVLRTAGLPPLIDDARVCTSEVVTNVYRHTRAPWIKVDVSLGHSRVTVNVHDDDPKSPPMPRGARLEEPGGRGLMLVDLLSDGWGTTRYGGLRPQSKAVWFSFDLRRRGLIA